MKIIPFTALACPLDHEPLSRKGVSWRCTNGHSFDVASQGYTNLLPVQNKRSLDPGDSKEMVAARRRFLEGGFYAHVADAVNHLVLSDVKPANTRSCLDAGCGEGYYLRHLANALDQGQTLELLGLDISKWAVLSASKQDKQANWTVGSNANLPVQTQTLDWVFCIFGFPVYGEFARVLKPDGKLLLVNAGPDHLKELREIIYPVLKPLSAKPMQITEGFSALSTQSVRYELTLNTPEEIADLLAMTPHLYRASAEGRTKAAALTSLTVTVDVTLTCLTPMEQV